MSVAEELAACYREADMLTGRIAEAYADVDRAYTRMLAEQDAARARAQVLEEARHGIIDNINRLRGTVRAGLSDYNTPKGV